MRGFFRGTVKLCFECSRPEGFVDELRRNIPLRRIRRTGDFCFELEYFYSDRAYVRRLAEKNKINIISEKCMGLPYILGKYRRRTGIFIGAAAGIAMIYVSSLFVWDVEVTGNETVSAIDIKAKLACLGFKEGTLKSSVNLDKLHNEYLINDDRISWIAVNFDGTVARVQVKETAKKPEGPDRTRKANIVASRDGRIIRVDAVDGQRTVEPGEIVSKGQMLISAFVETRHSGAILRSARGSVWASTERSYQAKVPLEYYDKEYTGKVKKKYTAEVLGKSAELNPFARISFKNCDRSVESGNITLFGGIQLPVRLTTQTYREYRLKKSTRTQNEALALARENIENQIKNELGTAVISSKKEHYELNGGCILLDVELECVENIAQYLDFEAT